MYAQAVEMRTPAFDGLSLDAIDGYRFHPTYLSGVDLYDDARLRLSGVSLAFQFDFLIPPDSERKMHG